MECFPSSLSSLSCLSCLSCPFIVSLLQSADARPTAQAADAVKRVTAMVPVLEQRQATQSMMSGSRLGAPSAISKRYS
jgi:hypothetical protein